MCVGRRNCDFSILSEHFQELCERSSLFQTIGKPSRVVEGCFQLGKALWCSWYQQSVLVLSPGSLTRFARTVQPSWTSRNMVDAFLKLCEGEKASLTCWNLRGPQQNTAKCSDPQRSLVNLGQHERTQRTLQYISEPVRTVESRRETM